MTMMQTQPPATAEDGDPWATYEGYLAAEHYTRELIPLLVGLGEPQLAGRVLDVYRQLNATLTTTLQELTRV